MTEIDILFSYCGDESCFVCGIPKPRMVEVPIDWDDDGEPISIYICSDCVKDWHEHFENRPGNRKSWEDLF